MTANTGIRTKKARNPNPFLERKLGCAIANRNAEANNRTTSEQTVLRLRLRRTLSFTLNSLFMESF